jgi:hypothetical protein
MPGALGPREGLGELRLGQRGNLIPRGPSWGLLFHVEQSVARKSVDRSRVDNFSSTPVLELESDKSSESGKSPSLKGL